MSDGNIHVIPENDFIEHVESADCPCRPTPDREEPSVLVHHAADLREDIEEGRIN